MTDRVPVLTLDGPSGAGKGTISRAAAKKLGWHYLDSGAIYRALAVASMDLGLDEDEAGIVESAGNLDLRFQCDPEYAVILSGKDITSRIQSEVCGNQASRLAAMPGVRAALLAKQRAFRQPPGLVADGRDMGTVVFQDALYKFFLTACPEIRAQRRVKQLKEKGMHVTLNQVIEELKQRDRRDETRQVAPLKAAVGAIVIDSSAMTIDEVVDRVTDAVRLK